MKKLVIFSSDDILLYQPTIINLYRFLLPQFDVTIVTFEPEYLGKEKNKTMKIIYIRPNKFIKHFLRFLDLITNAIFKRIDKYVFSFTFRSSLSRKYKAECLSSVVGNYIDNVVIAVDLMPLYVVQKIIEYVHFLSLEIYPNDCYLKKIRPEKILSVIIQSEQRYRYLFRDFKIKTFFIQNAPLLKNKAINLKPRSGLVWAGTVVKEFGVLSCFDYILAYPNEKMVFKGAVESKTKKIIIKKYNNLLISHRVVLDTVYLEVDKFIEYLSKFKIGFCFYNWELIKNNFNYESAPSGKLFMCLAAGVPVVGPNISAFKIIVEFGAGVLINDYNPATIHFAVKKIESEYETYSKNCYRAFEASCFDKNGILFKNYLLEIS